MIFTTPSFFIFFSIFIFLWWVFLPKKNNALRKTFLIISSYVFYSFTGIQWVITLFLTSLFTYFSSRMIEKSKNSKKIIGIISVLVLIGQLIFWKYIPWAILTWNEMPFMNDNLYINPPEFLFPIGLSFFTFHALSIIIPVWVEEKKSYSLIDTLCHISFFPALLAGPVLRYDNINYRWKKEWKWENVEWENGICRILIGATFKWVLASKCAEYADMAFNGFADNQWQFLLGIHAYALQIFFDFAGYSHMAIGFALLMGWKLPENFTMPYISMSIQDFWRNWHRSLSFFFRDNFYIHLLGGNKKGKNKALFNAFLTMLVSGLWHGANLTFILWGAYHGLLLVIHSLFKRFFKVSLPMLLSWFLTFESVVLGWILFKSESINDAIKIYDNFFDFENIFKGNFEFSITGIIWVALMFLVIIFERKILEFFLKISNLISEKNNFKSICISLNFLLGLCLWTYLIIYFGPTGVPDFIYNGF